MKRALVCLFSLLGALHAAAGSREVLIQRPITPPFIFDAPADVAPPPVLPVGAHVPPGHAFARPVARVDGTPTCPPLFRSFVPDPVDRALLLRDYRKNGYFLTPIELDLACKRFQRLQFHDLDALRDGRLRQEQATLEDYRHYVSEEVKISALLWTVYRGAVTRQERDTMQKRYLARLRQKAVIETLKT